MHVRLVAIAASLILGPLAALALPVTVLPDVRPQTQSSKADTVYRQGLEALTHNDLVGADRAFAESVRMDETFAPALLGRAEVASRKNDLPTALKYLTQASQVAPKDAYVQASLGRYYGVQRDYAKAETALSTAIQLDPSLLSARMDLADIYATSLNKPDRAIELYREAIAQNPEHAGAHYALGIALADRDLVESKRMLTKASQLDKNNPLPAIALARVALKQNQPDQALQWADNALRLDPNSIGAVLLRADALLASHRANEAIAELTKLAAKQPKNGDVQFRLATALHSQGKLPEALEAYRRVTEIAPRNAIAWNNLSALTLDLKNSPADAVRSAQKAVELTPDDPQVRDTLGWAQWKAGNKDAALNELLAASKLSATDPGIWYHLGVVYAGTNRKQEAVTALNRALQIDAKFFAASDAQARLKALK